MTDLILQIFFEFFDTTESSQPENKNKKQYICIQCKAKKPDKPDVKPDSKIRDISTLALSNIIYLYPM